MLSSHRGSVLVGRSPQGECGLKYDTQGKFRFRGGGRSPQRECGLKLHVTVEHVQFRRRSPQGECGLKWDELGRQRLALVSLPARGVWIEMYRTRHHGRYAPSHSPQGECGLKFLDRLVKRSVPGSLSLRRAWIEIGVYSVPATAWMSLSLFMSSVLRTCGDDSACAGLLVSMTIRGVKASLWARMRGLRCAGLLTQRISQS